MYLCMQQKKPTNVYKKCSRDENIMKCHENG